MTAVARSLLLIAFVWLLPFHDADARERYLCTKVFDGDTIELEDVGRVRLIGVDCPEIGERTNGVLGFSAEASAYTRLLVEGKRVRLEYDRERKDKYDRTLAYVFLEDGSFVNALIVRMGYGYAYTRFPFRYADRFRRLEQEARQANRGVWGFGAEREDFGTGPNAGKLGLRTNDASAETTVYITRTGRKYHREGCRSLARSMIAISLADAVLRYGPCGICSPPTLGSPGPAGITQPKPQRTPSGGSGRCQAITKKGTQCKRSARAGSSYCWQHAR
jgi:micrococcal nuclease